MTLSETQSDILLEALNGITAAQLEYAESHKDAGDGYAHMPRESWTSVDDENLARFMTENGIDACGLDAETLADIALDNFEMVARHIFSGEPGTLFCCGAYPVQEVEMQVSFADLSTACGFAVTANDVVDLGTSPDAYIGRVNTRDLLAYLTSDVIWCADIAADTLAKQIKERAA